MKKQQRHLTRDELLKKLSAPPEQIVDVPGVGPVRLQTPTFSRLIELRATCENEEDYRMGMILAACPDLRAEDLSALKVGNGIAVAALVAAVTGMDKPVTDETVGKQSRR